MEKRVECEQSNIPHRKGARVSVTHTSVSMCTGLLFLLGICLASPLQRFWPSAEKWLSVTALAAVFVPVTYKPKF